MLTDEEYKNMSVKEFTKAAKNYESDHAGFIRCVKKRLPGYFGGTGKGRIFRPFGRRMWTRANDFSACGKYPDRHYTGLDLTPAMIEQAKRKIFRMLIL